ncbi:branched-chain alpha-keto acid dehydrogenase subunit E2 [Pseudomonas sp. BAY1663]|uniref:E3 binding domain-containing protein n=1 Tax=Pseudomonas sp. BAY1663 TaxID=1439940 RepID=UPI00042E03F8|nr:E3 binding domain-containing protein [Pseudomonas sp. BAY1663]EXF45262.1 branched-chain alpha-keto acid dehydrogenase subunit E2 [Pseudomonas sp. BAY1663]
MKVTFTHKNGRKQVMDEKFAKILSDLGKGSYGVAAMAQPAVEPASAPPVQSEPQQELRASKAARELAAAHGVDLAQVVGTGEAGAITKPDVQAFIDAKE